VNTPSVLPLQTPDVQIYSVPSQSTLATPTPTPQITYRVVNVAIRDFLYLRAGPGINYSVIVRVPAGTRGITLGNIRTANGTTIWQQVSIGKYTGFVNEIYLEAE
jgi:uncharacterized protein YgiM (DUF1202 family)